MDSKRSTKDFTDSPMRSLSSFKDEIPGGEFPSTKDSDENTIKSVLQKSQKFVTSSPFHITMILLVFVHCVLLTAELVLAMTGKVDTSTVAVLAPTCLAILSFFLFEVTFRIFITGFKILKIRLEVFDILVVVTSLVLDSIVFAGKLDETYDWTRAFSYLILLRCWRLYGVYYVDVNQIRNDLRTDIEMAKYGRRQAETQADALQSERDAQLKEIFYLREFLSQHSLDPDFHIPDCVQSSSPVRTNPGYSRTISIDRAETMREETRLYPAYSEESAISSIADDKHRQVTAVHNASPLYRVSDETLENGSEASEREDEEETDIRSERSDGSAYESAQEEDDIGVGVNKEETSRRDGGQRVESEERKEVSETSINNSVEGVEVKVERDLQVSSGSREKELVSSSVGGIDNPVFQGTLQDEEEEESSHREEMEPSSEDSPSKESAFKEGRSRTGSELVYVTEDVNGIPMTSL